MRIVDSSRSLSRLRPSPALLAALVFCLTSCSPSAHAAQAKTPGHLLIYAIDVEGGQSTLLVDTATHASLLVDTGWPNVNGKSADPVEKGMHDAGEPDQTGRDASASRPPCTMQASPALITC